MEEPVKKEVSPAETAPSAIDRYLKAELTDQARKDARTLSMKQDQDGDLLEEFTRRLHVRFGMDVISEFQLSLASPTQIKLEAKGYRPIVVTLAGVLCFAVGTSEFPSLATALAAAKK